MSILKLTITNPQGAGQTLDLQELPITIGRDPQSSIVLNDPSISRKHAEILLKDDKLFVLKKTIFGHFSVNNQEVSEHELSSEDTVLLGKFSIKLESQGPEQSDVPTGQKAEGTNPEDQYHSPDELESNYNPGHNSNHDSDEHQKVETIQLTTAFSQLLPAKEIPKGILKEDQTEHLANDGIQYLLRFPSGGYLADEFELTKPKVMVGRAEDCDLVLNHDSISRAHAQFTKTGSNYRLDNLSTINPIFVNGIAIQTTILSSNDIIQIGNIELSYFAHKSGEALESPISAPDQLLPMEDSPVEKVIGEGFDFSPGKKKNKRLIDKFRNLPASLQVVIGVPVIALIIWLIAGDDGKTPAKKAQTVATGIAKNFEALSKEQQQFVKAQYSLGFEYFKNQDFDKSLFEIEKIFAVVDDYLNSREIQQYAQEGRRKVQLQIEEAKRRDQQKRIEQEVQQLIAKAEKQFKEKSYSLALETLGEIFILDPDQLVAMQLKQKIETSLEDEKKAIEEQARLAKRIEQERLEIEEATHLREKNQFQAAIDLINSILKRPELPIVTERLANQELENTKNELASLIDPINQEGMEKKQSQEFAQAYKLFEQVLELDPNNTVANKQTDEIFDLLHERAKNTYIEAVLAESVSDFDAAQRLYRECRELAPSTSIYSERAARKLSRYFEIGNAKS